MSISTAARPPAATTIAAARVALELRLFFRDRAQVVFSFAYPVLMLVIFGSVTRGSVAGGVTFTQYFVPGILATGIMLTSFQALGIDIAVDRDGGALARLQALGTPAAAYFAGKAGQVVVTTAAQVVLLLAAARGLFGVALPRGVAGWATFGWVALLGSLAGTVLGIAVSGFPRSARSASPVVSATALVLQFFSGVFFVFATLPAWMQQVAAVFPLKWLTQGMRSVFLPDGAARAEVAGSWEHGRTALVLATWAVAGLLVCVRTFTWRKDEL